MKILFTILAVICVFATCACYELNQRERNDTSSYAIGWTGSISFMMSIIFVYLAIKYY